MENTTYDDFLLKRIRDIIVHTVNEDFLSETNTEDLLERIKDLAGNMHDVGIAPYFHRITENPREAAFAEQWQKDNFPRAGVNYGHGALQDMFITEGEPFRTRTIVEEITNRDRRIVATVIQWLGTNCGMAFLSASLEKCGYKIVEVEN